MGINNEINININTTSTPQYQSDLDVNGSYKESVFTMCNGKNAKVSIMDVNDNEEVEGYDEYKINININGKAISLKIFINNMIRIEDLKSSLLKICRSFSNMSQKVLEDFSRECKALFLTDKIKFDATTNAAGLTIAKLNEIFISNEKIIESPKDNCKNMLVHELGHLVDNYKSDNQNVKISKTLEDKISLLQQLISTSNLAEEHLGNNKQGLRVLNKPSEFFAEYYLYHNNEMDDTNITKTLFDTLENLSSNKNSNNNSQIVQILEVYNELKQEYNAQIQILEHSTTNRSPEYGRILSLENVYEHNARITKNSDRN